MDAGLFVEFSAYKAHPCRRRSGRAWPQLPAGLGILADARTFLRQLLANSTGAAPSEHQGMARPISPNGARVGKHSFGPNFDIHASPMRPGARGRRLPGGAAAGPPHHLLRYRRQPQLVHAVLERAAAADHAQFLGLFPAWVLAHPARSAQNCGAGSPRRRHHPATAASPWCRTCCAPQSNTSIPVVCG